jgi:predicted NBD/HSP70 family sugar kinase
MTPKIKKGIQSSSVHLNRQKNYSAVLNTIREHSAIIQPEISRITDISYPTVRSIIIELKKKHLVRYIRKENSSGGRRPLVISFNQEAGYVAAVEIGMDFSGVISDLSGRIVFRGKTEFKNGLLNLKELNNYIKEIIKQSGIVRSKLLGIGIGISGLVNKAGEIIVKYYENEKTRAVRDILPVKEAARKEFKVPVMVLNDADAGMMAEYYMGVAMNIDNGIYLLKRSTGMGFGILANGELLTGRDGFAGENRGIFSVKAIESLENNPKITEPLIDDLLKLIFFLNPEMIIFGGELSELSKEFLEQVKSEIVKQEPIYGNIILETASLKTDSVVCGMVYMLLQKFFSFNF